MFGKKKRKPTSQRKQEPWEKIKDRRDRALVKAAATDPNVLAQMIKKAYGIEIVPMDQARLDRMAIRKAYYDRAEALFSDEKFSPEELEDAIFSELDETFEAEEEPIVNEPHWRPYPVRHQYPVRHTGRTTYRMPQPGTRTSAGSPSSNDEAYALGKKAVIDFFNRASGQTGSAATTYAVEIDGKLVEMSAEAYAVLRDQREQLKELNAKIASEKTGESKTATPKEMTKPDTDEITPTAIPPLQANGDQASLQSGSTETKTQEEHTDSPAQ